MTINIQEKISKLKEKKKSLEAKQKLLMEKEKQKAARLNYKKYSNIGKIAFKAGIEKLDDSMLLGAFLEIAKQSSSIEKINLWKELGESRINKEKADGEIAVSISFNGKIGQNEKSTMRSLGFRYNKFRNEFYGYGVEEQINQKLNGFDYKIEILNN